MSQQFQQIRALRQTVSNSTQALVWLTVGVIYVAAFIAFLVLGAIAGWGLWAVLIEAVTLPFTILLIQRQLALWSLSYLEQMPTQSMSEPVVTVIPEIEGYHQETPVYVPSLEAMELPAYGEGYAVQQ